MDRFDRYIARHILVPFVFSVTFVVFLVFVFQLQRIATAAVGFGLEPSDVVVIFVSALPPFLVLAVPMAFLLSVLIGYSRLSGDLELIAFRAAGASPLRLARVPIVAGALIASLCLPLAYWGEPYGFQVLYDRLVDVGLRNITGAIRPGVFNEDFRGIALYASARNDDGSLEDVLLFDERDQARPVLITAKSGRLDPRGRHDLVVTLSLGEMHLGRGEEAQQKAARYDRVRFDRAQLGVDTQRELRERTKWVSEINRLPSKDMWKWSQELGPDSPLGRRIEKTYWRRFAFPSMAFVFAIIGAAIALRARPDGRAKSAIIAMFSVVLYYVSTRVGDYAAVHYRGTPFWAAFIPNTIAFIAGLIALSRAGRPT